MTRGSEGATSQRAVIKARSGMDLWELDYAQDDDACEVALKSPRTGDSGVHAATLRALLRASRRRGAWSGGAPAGEDSFPRTHLHAARSRSIAAISLLTSSGRVTVFMANPVPRNRPGRGENPMAGEHRRGGIAGCPSPLVHALAAKPASVQRNELNRALKVLAEE
jgi:hypothetical protein